MARIGVSVEVTEESTKQNDYSNLPLGIYKLEITASAVPESGEGTADHKLAVNATVEVVEPAEYKGRKFFQNYNLINPSLNKDNVRMAEQIGKKQYSCLVRALGMTEGPEESEELHYHEFYAQVGVGKSSVGKDGKQYEARNEIKKYFYPDEGVEPTPAIDAVQPTPAAANDNKPAARAATPAAAARPAAAAGSKPWGKKVA